MFHSAAVKLTAWYMVIIMLLSIGCSLAIYRVSGYDLARNNRRQATFFNGFLGPTDFDNYNRLRQGQLNEDLDHLKTNLILFNILVLFGGSIASYALARRTLQPLEESIEQQSRFTADASHELRTPLTAMQTEIEVALRNKSLTKVEALRLLDSNLEEVGKLKSLSDGLLQLASENSDSFIKENVSLDHVITEALHRQQKFAKAKKINIDYQPTKTAVMGDKQSLVELVNVLVDNAIKYSSGGSKILISSSRKDKNAVIKIADQGQGIGASDLPHIFDRFYRADPSRNKEKISGYGLGLAIAKKIVDLHKGRIQVLSAPGKGSTFIIELPKI